MTDNPRWIEEGLAVFQAKVLGHGWPADPKLQILLEVTFYAGARWLFNIIEEEGTTADVLHRLDIELGEHADRIRLLSGSE